MKILAYSMQSVANAVFTATGAYPVTCPPFNHQTFNPHVFEQVDAIWLGLHGIKSDPRYLYGDEILAFPHNIRVKALFANDVAQLSLHGKIVFASSCYLPATDFPDAFKAAGAVVIGGPGENYGNTERPVGADRLGSILFGYLQQAMDVAQALATAKESLNPKVAAELDALGFEIL